jgi:hypothetical protein
MRKRRDEEEIDIRSKMMFRIEVVGRDREEEEEEEEG